MKPKVIIELRNGVVVDVSSDIDMDAIVVDYDTDGTDIDALTVIPTTGDEAMCSMYNVDVNAKRVRNLYSVIEHDLST